jgi:hypothetical protein
VVGERDDGAGDDDDVTWLPAIDGSPQVMDVLVELVRGAGGRALGPERFQHLVAVHRTFTLAREQLDESRRLPPAPAPVDDGLALDDDFEAAQQPDGHGGVLVPRTRAPSAAGSPTARRPQAIRYPDQVFR